jgi:DNA-binding XRE family transcriptional regulator
VAGRQRGEVEGVTEPLAGFAGLLRGLRVEAGLTQEELAEAAGVSVRPSLTWRAGR